MKRYVPNRCVVHSFRHSFRDRLRAVETPSEIADDLGGWTGRSIGQSYGMGYDLDVLQRWMSRLDPQYFQRFASRPRACSPKRVGHNPQFTYRKYGVFYLSRHILKDIRHKYEHDKVVMSLRTQSREAAAKSARAIAAGLDENWMSLSHLEGKRCGLCGLRRR